MGSMYRREFLSHSIGWSAAVGTLSVSAGCGTILHRERVGRPHSNQLDWSVVALDALGLILFFVPGVIAFVVDFSTGAIYLPPAYGAPYPCTSYRPQQQHLAAGPSAPSIGSGHSVELRRVPLAKNELSPPRIEQVVSDHAGWPIALSHPATRASALANLDEYGHVRQRHEEDHDFGRSPKQILKRLFSA